MNLCRQNICLALYAWLLFLSPFLVSAEPTNADYALGVQQYNQSDWTNAVLNFSKSIDTGYDLYDSYSYRAYSRAELNDASGATQDCNQVIKLYPGASGYYWRARINVILTNYDAALADFAVGMQLGPKDKPEDFANELSIWCYHCACEDIRTNYLKSAMTNLNRAIYLVPTNSMPYAQRGFLKILQGRFQSASEDENSAIKFRPDLAFGYELRAFARCETEDNLGALEDCTNALNLYAKAELRWQTNNVGKVLPKDFKNIPLPMQGLQNFIGGNYEKSATLWRQLLSGEESMPEPWIGYTEKWIERAKAKETGH